MDCTDHGERQGEGEGCVFLAAPWGAALLDLDGLRASRSDLTSSDLRPPATTHAPPSPAALNFPRYKIIVQAMVGQQKQQGVRVVSRCLWDTDTDSCSSYTYNSDTLWATVMVFGLYVE